MLSKNSKPFKTTTAKQTSENYKIQAFKIINLQILLTTLSLSLLENFIMNEWKCNVPLGDQLSIVLML